MLKVKGEDSPQSRTKREFLAEWVEAVNDHGGFGHWSADVSYSPSDLYDVLARHAWPTCTARAGRGRPSRRRCSAIEQVPAALFLPCALVGACERVEVRGRGTVVVDPRAQCRAAVDDVDGEAVVTPIPIRLRFRFSITALTV